MLSWSLVLVAIAYHLLYQRRVRTDFADVEFEFEERRIPSSDGFI